MNNMKRKIGEYMFHNLVLIMWESNADIQKFVDNSIKEGMNISVNIIKDKNVNIHEEDVDIHNEDVDKIQEITVESVQDILVREQFDPKDSFLVTDDIESIYEAYILGLAVMGYRRPEDEFGCDQAVRYVVEELSEIDEEFFNMVYCRAHDIPLMIASTARTYIREMTLDDLPDMRKLYESDGVRQWVEPLYEPEEERKFSAAYIENMYKFYGYGLWLVFDKETDELIGRAGLSNRTLDGKEEVELGYIIHGERQHEGIGYEVSGAILEYAKEALGIERVFLCTEKANTRSMALALKLGFILYGENDEYFILTCTL